MHSLKLLFFASLGLALANPADADKLPYTAPFFYGQTAVQLKGTPTSPLSIIRFVSDVSSTMPFDALSKVGLPDHNYFIYDVQTGFSVGASLSATDLGAAGVDALHGDLYSVDIATLINGVAVYPGDVVNSVGVKTFDSLANGFPSGLNLDALSFHPVSGDLVFSIDVQANLGGTMFCADDLIRWDGVSYTLFFSGGCVGNVNALDLLENGAILLSFDRDWNFGGILIRDQNVLEINMAGSFFGFDPSFADNSQSAADMSALDADLTASAGSVAFSVGSISVAEDVGAFTLDVVRQGGSAGAVDVHLITFADTATFNVDYIPIDVVLTFADGVSGTLSQSITILPDALVEGSEFFEVRMALTSGGASLGTPNILTVEILDAEDFLFRDGFE